jgi:hypothetical protein
MRAATLRVRKCAERRTKCAILQHRRSEGAR